MQCLNCKIEMFNYDVTTKHAQLSYDTCKQCGSLWLDAGELDKLANEKMSTLRRSRFGAGKVSRSD